MLSRPGDSNPEPTVYDTVALPIELGRHECSQNYTNLFSVLRERLLVGFLSLRASLTLLLSILFTLPFPLLDAPYVGRSESQFGHNNRKLSSVLFRQLPSI